MSEDALDPIDSIQLRARSRIRSLAIRRTYGLPTLLWVTLPVTTACGPSTPLHGEADLLVEVDSVLHLGWSWAGQIEALDGVAPGRFAAWSPEGGRIARLGAEEEDVRVLDVDTLEEVVLAEIERGGAVSWSPDGRRIAFREETATGDGETEWDLAVVDLDGGQRSRLTETLDDTVWAATWSPNGAWIAVSADRLRLYRPDGTEGTSFPIPYLVAQWSSDSSRLLVSNNDGLREIELGSGATEKLADFHVFAWSEARREIASDVTKQHDDKRLSCDVVVTSERPFDPRVIAAAPAGACYSPLQWSPDGEQLLVGMVWWRGPGHEESENRPRELWVMDADGSHQRLLARGVDSKTSLAAEWRPPDR